MSTLWNVDVVRRADREITLRLVSVHPDAGPFGTDAAFGLRLLFEEAREFNQDFKEVATGPLGDEVTEDNIYDGDWMRENASRFVSSLRIEEPDVPDDVPVGAVATYVIEVTDPRYLEHLKEGQKWHSAAFS